MNFYKHHIGDYDADTAHLSWLEDMAYTRLMRLYYRREAPIPADLIQACRLVRASSKQEREAVESVLNEFFDLADDGWHNKRCDQEIGSAHTKADKNREVGKLGGRPRKKETAMVSENNHDGFKSEPIDNPSQTPDTRHQINPLSDQPPSQPETSPRDADAGSGGEMVPLIPTQPGQWLIHFNAKHGTAFDASSQFDRKSVWQTFTRWVQAGISTADVDAGVVEAVRTATSPIGNLPAYVERLLLNRKQLPAGQQGENRRKSLTEQRAETLDALTGRNRAKAISGATERDITGEARRVE